LTFSVDARSTMPHQINEEFSPRVENKFSKSTVVLKLLRHARSTMP